MEGLISLLVLALLFVLLGPFVMALIALIQISSLRRELNEIRKANAASSGVTDAPAVAVVPPKVVPVLSRAVPPLPTPVVRKPRPALEFLVGGKAAAFAGAAILVMGIAFLVGYAIQHSWLGPGARVVLGLLSGGALIGVGHGLECRGGGKYGLLARALTGAGSALFYFVVFSAYGIYHLIGASAAGIGLLVSAVAVFGLAMVYRSQAVGVLGVLGALITPLLIGGEMEKGVFPLIYVAVINVPVLLLGVRRKWQILYNVAFVFTLFYFCAWLDWIGAGEYGTGLFFAVLYFMEFAALGLLKLRCEQKIMGRVVDRIRLGAASLLLLWAAYWVMDCAGWNAWMGLILLLLALLHIGFAALARRWLSRFSEDILSFLGGGLLFAVLALPAQLDGEWVSLGWALEGVAVAWFAVRVKSRTLLGAAFLIGGIGILKALCFDFSLYTHVPRPFLNVRLGVGLLSCGLLAVQGWLGGRFSVEKGHSERWRDGVWWVGILAGLVVFSADSFWTMGFEDESAWLAISMALLAVGAATLLMARPGASLRILGSLLLGVLPLQIIWFYLLLGNRIFDYGWTPFLSPVPWMFLAGLGTVIFWLQPKMPTEHSVGPVSGRTYRLLLNITALITALVVLTMEMARMDSEWAGPLVTLLWALWALALTVFGLMRNAAPYRFFGLILFGVTTLKVLVVDSSELNGLERIAAFMGAGVFLLILSFIYQKVASRFLPAEEKK